MGFYFYISYQKAGQHGHLPCCPAMRVCFLIYVPLKRVLYCSYGRNGNRYIKAAHDTVPQNEACLLYTSVARMVAIESVGGESAPDAPFGPGPRAALDEMLKLCGEYGFATDIYHGAMGSADYNGKACLLYTSRCV